MLPGRLAALTHPLNDGRGIVLPDREWYDPDCCLVVSSGLSWIRKGEVAVLAPDHGAFVRVDDRREMRLVGVVKPWWESVLGKWTADGFVTGPGWCLIDRETVKNGGILTTKDEFSGVATVLSDNGEVQEAGHGCVYDKRDVLYTFHDTLPKTWALLRSKNAPRRWLRSLERLAEDRVHQKGA